MPAFRHPHVPPHPVVQRQNMELSIVSGATGSFVVTGNKDPLSPRGPPPLVRRLLVIKPLLYLYVFSSFKILLNTIIRTEKKSPGVDQEKEGVAIALTGSRNVNFALFRSMGKAEWEPGNTRRGTAHLTQEEARLCESKLKVSWKPAIRFAVAL
ncbi:hypothetical protein AVEN_222405-1 [Araneus ventricosus]|uniref:Uncharacterized protein n=1 Tax=Araneus ventricosus TaxID=182803 RepID=A0A4Y2MRL7_ARAVE|nr:hypothetical protein AVEN_222405-1 [Araneus ventricosus]